MSALFKGWICRVATAACLFLLAAVPVRGEVVVAEGSSPGDQANAREQALVDALREAVRVGTGVNLQSATRMENFVLEYDRVFEQAFGYVKDYSVVASGLREDGFYRVKVRADVSPGQPGMKESMALRQIVRLRKSPRVAVEVDELITGVPAGSNLAKAWFEQAALECQLRLVDATRAGRTEGQLARRDEALGQRRDARFRQAGLTGAADFILEVVIRGRHLGARKIYGVLTQSFEISGDLRAVRADTGEVLVALPLSSRGDLTSQKQSVAEAARELLGRQLEGRAADRSDGAWALFRRIFRVWTTELDLGAIVGIEFSGLSPDEWRALKEGLAKAEKISAVWPREYDAKGLARLDLETRLDAAGVEAAVRDVLRGAFALERETPNHLLFARAASSGKGSPVAAVGTRPTTAPSPTGDPVVVAATPGRMGLPPWAWGAAGLGAAGVAGAWAFQRQRRRRPRDEE